MNFETDSIQPYIKNDKKKPHPQVLDYRLLKIYKSDWFNFHQIQYYRKKAILAATKMKIFTIYGSEGNIIRESLIKRGWIEKFAPKYLRHLQLRSIESLLENVEPNNEYERAIISKMADKFYANFQWNSPILCRYKCLTGLPYTNRIIRERTLDFTNLDGLHKCISKIQKYKIPGYDNVQTPRLHTLTLKEDYDDFLKSYRITYCLSLLLFISKEINTERIFHELGTIPVSIIRFAAEIVRAKMSYAVNSDLNTITDFICTEEFGDNEWKIYFQNINNLISGRAKLKETSLQESQKYLTECKDIILEANKHWPLLPWIGYNNLWILKPCGSCNGNGIVIKQEHSEIMIAVQKRLDKRYIIQKYIERPFLVHNTKFDIHQFIMLTVTEAKFSIWMYRDSCIKFSEFEYDLTNLSKSIHIPNNPSTINSININNNNNNNNSQKKLKIRSEQLPSYNMWTSEQLRTYLNEQKHEDIWYNQIYGDIKKIIIAIILASLDKNRFIPKTFELFRCDFILTENFMPILIEINSSPDMIPKTIIQEKLFPIILGDLIKVVIDLPKNKKSPTGHFELIYEYDSNDITSKLGV